jgi:hypothetical protein
LLEVTTVALARISRRSDTSGLPELRCFSIASRDCPMVSGTRNRVNTMPPRQIAANTEKAKASPGQASIRGKAKTTTKLNPQLLIDAMLMPGPRTRSGKTSDIMTCGSGPMLIAKEAI